MEHDGIFTCWLKALLDSSAATACWARADVERRRCWNASWEPWKSPGGTSPSWENRRRFPDMKSRERWWDTCRRWMTLRTGRSSLKRCCGSEQRCSGAGTPRRHSSRMFVSGRFQASERKLSAGVFFPAAALGLNPLVLSDRRGPLHTRLVCQR